MFFSKAAIVAFFEFHALEVLKLYPVINDDVFGALSYFSTDYIFVCPTRNMAIQMAKRNLPVRMYHFLHSPSKDPSNHESKCDENGIVCHAAELVNNFFIFICDIIFYNFI